MKTKKHIKNHTKWQNVESRFNLAGVQFSDYNLVCGKQGLKPGTVLNLTWERSNKYDPLAIRVSYHKVNLGYVPRGTIYQSECHRIHNKSNKLIAVLTAFNKNNPSWCMITIQIKTTEMQQVELADIDMG